MIQDFRFAFRQLIKTPGFTIIALLTLALAIGVNSAVFSLINGVVLRPVIPLRPAEVVSVFSAKQNTKDYRQFSYAEYQVLRENTDVFADVAAVNFALAGLGRDEGMRRSFVFMTSENFFSLAGVEPALGRFYNAEESRPEREHSGRGREPRFLETDGRQTRFRRQHPLRKRATVHGDRRSSGRIQWNQRAPCSRRLAAAGRLFPNEFSLQRLDRYSGPGPSEELRAECHRAAPVRALTIESAKPRLPVLAQRLTAIQPPDSTGPRDLLIQKPSRVSISTTPEDDGPITLIGVLLMAMAGAVLLIASLNLANMLLARGTARAKEIALRLALGASRWRIIRQLLCEGLLLALAGGALGLALSMWSNGALVRSLGSLFSSMSFSIIVDIAAGR